ncbi:hypothetical protein V5O48_014964 [Marasmius crinis-equi]|uniref:Uncharacterized protein n=1 Tax=Marasmius crinis-equi TaxID=585013 RepID=A0ABR3EW48_9AGAR
MGVNDHIKRGTLKQALQAGLIPHGKPLNYLELPGLPSHDGFKATQLQMDIRAYQWTRELCKNRSYPVQIGNWHLVATTHCSHHAHIDTAGYATMIAPQIGAKLFFLLIPANDANTFEQANGSLLFAETAHNMENEVGMVVVPVLLRPGDVL